MAGRAGEVCGGVEVDATGGGTKSLREIALGINHYDPVFTANGNTHFDSPRSVTSSSGAVSGLSLEVPTLLLPAASVASDSFARGEAEPSCASAAALTGVALLSAVPPGEEGLDGVARSRSRPTTPTPLSKFSTSSPREEAAAALAPRLALDVVVDRSSAVSVRLAAWPEAYESAEGDEAAVRAAAASLCSRAALSAASRARFSAISARLRSDTARAKDRQCVG